MIKKKSFVGLNYILTWAGKWKDSGEIPSESTATYLEPRVLSEKFESTIVSNLIESYRYDNDYRYDQCIDNYSYSHRDWKKCVPRNDVSETLFSPGSCHNRQKPQAPTPQAPIRNRQTRKIANAKGLNRNTNFTT